MFTLARFFLFACLLSHYVYPNNYPTRVVRAKLPPICSASFDLHLREGVSYSSPSSNQVNSFFNLATSYCSTAYEKTSSCCATLLYMLVNSNEVSQNILHFSFFKPVPCAIKAKL